MKKSEKTMIAIEGVPHWKTNQPKKLASKRDLKRLSIALSPYMVEITNAADRIVFWVFNKILLPFFIALETILFTLQKYIGAV